MPISTRQYAAHSCFAGARFHYRSLPAEVSDSQQNYNSHSAPTDVNLTLSGCDIAHINL
jgi:hypothetical protein